MGQMAILIEDDVSMFELACAIELFAMPRPEFDHWYNADVVSFSSHEKCSPGAVTLNCKTIQSLAPYQTLVIPSWRFNTSKPSITLQREIKQFVAAHKTVLTFCSGAFLLAELNVLTGKQATTHWRYADAFQSKFPDVKYQADVLYTFDDHIGCSAGSAAGIDLGLEFIRREKGYEVANQVARRMVVSTHRQGGQAQFVETPVPSIKNALSDTLDWAAKNIDQGLDAETLAFKANMSRRNFDRKFKSTMGITVTQWLIDHRIRRAKELLETTAWGIDQVAQFSGFETPVTLRHHFLKSVGVSPRDYRRQFQATR